MRRKRVRTAVLLTALRARFPDHESARRYLEKRRWPTGPRCPFCGRLERITPRQRVGFYRCNTCAEDFTIRTGTIMERSHIPLHKWLYAAHLARKGIRAMQLAKTIGISWKSAGFLLERIREAGGAEKLASQSGSGR